MKYRDTPEYYGQKRELKPAAKKALALMAILLSVATVGAVAKNHEKIGDFLAYSSVDKDIESNYEVTDNGIGKPDTKLNIEPNDLAYIIENKDGIENFRGDRITYQAVPEGEMLVLEKGAAIRTSAAVGMDGEKTTLAILQEQVPLDKLEGYFYWQCENGDSFYGVSNNDSEKVFPNVKFEESKTVENDDDISWVNVTEANFVKTS